MLWSARLTHRSVQASWQSGDCIIEIVAVFAMAQDTFSLFDVSAGAFQIVDACVEAREWVGGRQFVGKRRFFRVEVKHKDS